MNVIDFIENGATIKNPNYKKGSKNPLTASPYLVSNDPKDAITPTDLGARNLIDKTYGLTAFDIKGNKYDKYGVVVNPNSTQEELNLQRAKNQTAIEQTAHALGQIVENEILLGTALGVSNLVDWVANWFIKEPNDYTNEVSSFFEDLQNKNKERLAIYQENPNASWQIGDFAWWANNLVSVGSTVSLMLPSMGVAKGLNWLGKVKFINKAALNTAKAIANVGNRVDKGKRLLFRPHRFVTEAGNFIEAGAAAFASRIGEGYMEARETYNTVYEKSLEELSKMSDADKADLIERNPDYANMTDDEIAKDLASISGRNTMMEDLPLLLLDFFQYKSINALYKNKLKDASVAARARLEHKNTMRKIAGLDEKDITTMAVIKEGLTYGIKNPGNIIKSIPFTEGIEEGWQGIVQQRSEELYKMALDPTIDSKSIGSYLTDGNIWEQAFWGIIGGAVFQGLGSAAGTIKSEIDRAKQNKRLSKANQKEKLTIERARQNEINTRFDKMNAFIDKMNQLNKGEHYSEIETDEKGKPILVNGVAKARKLNEEQIFFEKEKLINEFVDDLVINSINNGTYELAKEFIESEYFDKYFANNGLRQSDVDTYIKDRVQSRLESTKDLYLKNLDILTTVIDDPYYYSLQAAASELTREELSIEAYDDIIKQYDEKLQTANETSRLTDGSYDRELISVIKNALNYLNTQEEQIRKDYNAKIISKAAMNESIKQINTSRNKFYQSLAEVKSDLESIKKLKESAKALKIDTDLEGANAEYSKILKELDTILYAEEFDILTNTTKEILRNRAINDINRQISQGNLPVGEDAIKDLYSHLDYSITQLAYERIANAYKLVEDYVNDAENPNEAFDKLMSSDETLDKKLLDALDIVKLSAKNGSIYYQSLVDARDKAIKKKEKEAIEAQKVYTNGDEVKEEVKEQVKAQATQLINNAENADNSSTGENEQSFAEQLIADAAEDYNRENELQQKAGKEFDPYYSGETYGIDTTFNDLIIKNPNKRQYVDIIANIKKPTYDDPNYKRIMDILMDILIKDHGVDERTANAIAREQIGGILRAWATNNLTNPSVRQKYAILARQLQYGLTFDKKNGLYSATSILEDTEAKYKIIDELISLFKEDNDVKGATLPVDKFFEYILTNEELDYNAARTIFNYLTDYLLYRRINTTDNYVFNNFRNNPTDFFNKLKEIKAKRDSISEHMHISLSKPYIENIEERKRFYKLQKEALEAAKKGEKVYIITDPKNNSVLQVICKGIEIGHITKTKTTDSKNTKYKKKINVTGLWWEVSKTKNGYESTYDDFFKYLHENKDNNSKEFINILRTIVTLNDNQDAPKRTPKEYQDLLLAALGDIKNSGLVNNSDLLYELLEKQIKNGVEIRYFAKDILNILNYNTNEDFEQSYQNWLRKVYNNYVQTKQIGDILDSNADGTVVVDFKYIGTQTPNYVEENKDVSSQPFVKELNTVIAVDRNGQIITESGNHKFNPATIFNAGTMGMLLTNANGNPIIARFAEANGVKKDSKLYKALYGHLTNILTRYQTEESYSINNLYEDLLEILVLRKNKNDNEFNPLFSGYTLVKINGGIAIAKALPYGQKEGKTPFVVAIYDKKFIKKGYQGEGGATRSITLFNEEGKPYANVLNGTRLSYAEHNPLYIHGVVEDLISGLKFNRSLTFLTNRNERNVKTNKHFYKENGKLYVEFGDTKLEYDSYFNFVMENDAFKVNVESKNGNFTHNTSENNDFYISVDKIEPGKTPYELLNPTAQVDEAVDLIESASSEVPVETAEVLRLIGADLERFVPMIESGAFRRRLYFEINPNKKVHARIENGKIYITKEGAKLIRNKPVELIRLLAHENFHHAIELTKPFERQALINDLLDTYEQFVKAVDERAYAGDNEAIRIKAWIEKNNFKPNGQFIKDDTNNREFAEEWLVESITNETITKFLNSVKYEGEIRKVEKKSILQRIIEILLDLFGIHLDNINESSILAKQITLLNDTTLENPSDVTINEQGEASINSPVEEEPIQEPIIPEEEVIEEEEEDEDDEFAGMMSATLPFIELDETQDYTEESLNDFTDNVQYNPLSYNSVTDMEKFIESYPPEFRDKIRTLLDTDGIKFICR